MNICSPCSGDFAFSKHTHLGSLEDVTLFLYNFKMVGGEESLNQLSFFFDGACTLSNFTLSPGLFTVNDPKDTISVVHVNKMLATVS